MKTYSVIPGPTKVSSEALQAFAVNYGSADIEEEFWDDYFGLEKNLQQILCTKNQVCIAVGE
eukprot:Pgem_evm1s5740